MDGEVIGVNTAIISPTGGSIGIGFAVPADTAVTVLDQLRQFGETRRGWLGVKVQSVNEDIADSLNDTDGVGALVSSVTPGGPAAKGGILDGDVILRFDGKDIASVRGLPRAVAQTQIGKEVDVEVLRKGQRKTLKIAVGRLTEDDDTIAKSGDKPRDKNGEPKTAGRALLGLRLEPITDELRARYKLDRKAKGLVVTEVDPASPAAQKKVKPGDVLVEAANDAVQSLADVEKGIAKMRKAGRDQILLSINEGKSDLRFINVPIQ
ncbi:MAG: PDZ domain-containing protein [Bauldia sp.]